MAFNRPNPVGPSLDIKGILKGTLVAAAISFAGSFILGIVYHAGGLMDSSLPLSSSVILLIGVLTGGFLTARKASTKGLFHGLAVGITTFVLILILMAFFTSAGIAFIPLIKKFLLCSVAGALGGILGISF